MAGLLDEPYIGYPQLRRSQSLLGGTPRGLLNTSPQISADTLRKLGEQLINIPTSTTRAITDPQLFARLLGITPNQQLSGFSAGYAGLPAKPPSDIGVVDPRNIDYSKGYSSGEEMGMMTALAAPLAPLARPVGRALGEQAYRQTEGLLQSQGLMPSITPQSQKIKETAEEFADKVKKLGFEANVQHSGSRAGASSYVTVTDPITGRYVVDPYRFSEHSKGPFQAQFVNEVSDIEKQFPIIEKTLMEMREQGPTALMQKQQFIEQKAEELIKDGLKPKTAYKQANEMAEKNSQKVEKEINNQGVFNPNISFDEFKSLAEKGQMRQARTFDQDVKDVINKKMPANIFEITGKNAYDYESGNFVKKLEKAGLYVDDDKLGTVIAGKTKKDVETLKEAQTPIEYGLSYGYKPEDIAKFYVNRRGNQADIGYAEFLDDLNYLNQRNTK